MKTLLTYLSSNSTPYIQAGLYALRKFLCEADIAPLEDLIIQSQLAQFLCLRLEIHIQLQAKEDYSIVFEILWIFINLLATKPRRPNEYLNQLVTPVMLNCIEKLFYNKYATIVDSALWVLISLTSINKNYKIAVLDSNIIEKCIYLTTKNPIEKLFYDKLLEFLEKMMKDIEVEKYKDKIGKTLTIFLNELYQSSSPTSFHIAIKGISNISNLNDLPKEITKRIINEGCVIKILRTDLSSNKHSLYYGMCILFNLLSLNDKVIESLLKLRIIDYYEIHLKKFMNDIDITPLIIGGMANIAAGKAEFKKEILNTILFAEEEKIYLNLLYSNTFYIKNEMINLIRNLTLSKNSEILDYLNDKGIINDILTLAIDERIRISFFSQYNNIITSFLINYHKANLPKNAKYYYVFEKYKEMLSSSNPLIKEKDIEKMTSIIKEVNN